METTLNIIIKDNKILLAKKKRGFGEGKFNSVGGKLEQGETPEQSMLRETFEEICIRPTEFKNVGKITFDEFFKGEKIKLVCHLFLTINWSGELAESDEMEPHWFDLNDIPYDKMFPDDKFWLPKIIEGKSVDCYFDFDENFNMISHNVIEI